MAHTNKHPARCFQTFVYDNVVQGQSNLAIFKTATQSSTDGAASADRAVNGNAATTITTCASTTAETSPWWKVDINEVVWVEQIKITSSDDAGNTHTHTDPYLN